MERNTREGTVEKKNDIVILGFSGKKRLVASEAGDSGGYRGREVS